MNPNIDFRYLKAFQMTAQCLNFSKAAQELNIAQSAISRQIKLLEEGMGEQLIVRSSKKVLLTEKGIELLAAISHFEEMTSIMTRQNNKKVIRVGIFHGLLENWFIGVIKEFKKISINQLDIVIENSAHLQKGLINREYDLIFTNENLQNELVTSLALFEERLVIIAKKEIDPKKLNSYPWVIYDQDDYLFTSLKQKSENVMSVKSITAVIKLVKECVGIAVVPEHLIKKEDRLLTYPIKSQRKTKVHLNTLNYQKYPAHLNELIQIIKDKA